MPRGPMAVRPFTQVENDLVLYRIGVLELVDQNRSIGLFNSSADSRVVAQEGFGPCQEPIECDPPGGEKPPANVLEEGPHECHDLLKVRLVNHEKLLGKPNNGGCLLERSLIPSGRGFPQILS